jgi:DNA polymerase III subunit gamma/tau
VSHLSFYRKWRPQRFEDVLGQDRVTRTLQNAIAGNRIVHAYLFCGHRGTGKTTTARILAKALNCQHGPTPTPCNTCAACVAISGGTSLDVIEIDAASNRGIDEIRDLREKVRLVPVEGRYKVYIIDEAHMLTAEASNALLKTLEEPPAHAILVLVTTEPHRLPTTITSRTQRFDFKRIPHGVILARLAAIAASEGITVDEEALHLMARSADGALRDAESLLDQLGAFCQGAITKADVLAVLGIVEEEIAEEITEAVIAGDAARCLACAARVIDEGKDVRQILRGLVEHFRDLLVVAMVRDPQGIVETTESRLAALRSQSARLSPGEIVQKIRLLSTAEAEARFTTQPRVVLEMALLRAARPDVDASLEGLAARLDALERRAGPTGEGQVPSGQPSSPGRPSREEAAVPARAPDGEKVGRGRTRRPAPAGPPPGAEPPVRPPSRGGPSRADAAPVTSARGEDEIAPLNFDLLQARWSSVMEEVKQRTRTVHAFLLESAPREIVGMDLILAVRHRFHMENLQNVKNRQIVEDALARVLGAPVRLRLTLDDAPAPRRELPESGTAAVRGDAPDALVEEAIRRFGNPVKEVRPRE